MPRRSIERNASGTVKAIDMKTGEPAGKHALPVICERIRYYREKSGTEQKALAKTVGVTANAVSNWENGRGRPDLNLIPELCRALDITMYELFEEEDPSGQYSEAEKALIAQYRGLTPGHKKAVDRLAETLAEVQLAEDVPPMKKVTYYSRTLAAGIGDPTEFDDAGEPLFLYASREADRADCVFCVGGDSMEPAYHNGDMVLVSRIPEAPDLKPGETGAFITGNETYIKVYEEDGLHSLNPAYKTMHFEDCDRVYLIGRVTGILDPSQIAAEEDVKRYQLLHPEEV